MKETTKQIGDKAESKAVSYLKKQGYDIQVCNYRYKKGEVDIIAIDTLHQPVLLVFIEVKYRKNDFYGNPEEFISVQKMNLLYDLSDHYTYQKKWDKDIRFDAISILGKGEVVHIKDIV